MVTGVKIRTLVNDGGRPTWRIVDLGDPRLRGEVILDWMRTATAEDVYKLIETLRSLR